MTETEYNAVVDWMALGGYTRAVAAIEGMPSRSPRLKMAYGVRQVRRTGVGRCRVYFDGSLDLMSVVSVTCAKLRSIAKIMLVTRFVMHVRRFYAVDVETFDEVSMKRVDRNFHIVVVSP